jgi:hypothetical protein
MTDTDDKKHLQFLWWEKASRDTIDFKKIYVDIAGDLIAGLLLSQIIYWHLPNDEGKSKLRVFKDGHWWVAKLREDWWNEIRISPKQFDRASGILADKKIIEKRNYMFNRFRTSHVRLLWDQFMKLWNKALEGLDQKESPVLTKGEDRSEPKVETGLTESVRPITEITTEITTENKPQSGKKSILTEKADTNDPLSQPSLEVDAAILLGGGRTSAPAGNGDGPAYDTANLDFQLSDWRVIDPAIQAATIHFLVAVRRVKPDLAVPGSKGRRSDWYKSIKDHLRDYTLDELPGLYKKAIVKATQGSWVEEVARPGALDKTLPKVAHKTKVGGGTTGLYRNVGVSPEAAREAAARMTAEITRTMAR